MPNRLVKETSPYLRQHAGNPVDWYPWGEEAFQKARQEDKPVLLSIGYSSCHWCHVMERESFENEETARLMNGSFVNIKVDREERPDLDHIYMEAVQSMTGQGGWPLTVFLTPQGDPFFGGTYFPPREAPGLPAFPTVLKAVAAAYRSRKDEIRKSAEAVRGHLEQSSYQKPAPGALSLDVLTGAYRAVAGSFDQENGGFGPAPKFPQPMVLEFLLRHHHRTGDPAALGMVERSLDRMARGGLFDQLGGGFHRYSTDAVWLVPHFEKMLYDNALLSSVYLHAYQAMGKAFYREVVVETLDYVLRDMTSPEGGFFSAQDADSEGEEGKYYLWTPEEVQSAAGPELAPLVLSYYGVTAQGNYEGKSVLHVTRDLDTAAREQNTDVATAAGRLKEARSRLLAFRQGRVPPGRDEKVLAGWNGLMLAGLAEAGRALREERYVTAAEKCASFLLQTLWKNGEPGIRGVGGVAHGFSLARRGLLRTYAEGQSKIPAFLEDYSSLAAGLLALYEATLESRWLAAVMEMAPVIVADFWDDSQGVFFDAAGTAESLVVRPRNIFDNALPSGSSQAAWLLLRLGLLTGEQQYAKIAVRAMSPMVPYLTQHPLGFGHWLGALDFHLGRPFEVALAGRRGDPRTQDLLQVIHDRYVPNKVIAARDDATPPEIAGLPLLEGRGMVGGVPTAYVCQAYRCLEPSTTPDHLAARLSGVVAAGL
ncbi:MAG: thioredoxin domain-containing protein [Chloroflexi bacterium]|nr:thioredoxin domain-containing protein [Chloroflexota bacterium]